ncbi:hypothetical protein J3B02_003962 [Coemansia erecta]|nr:hypothetical protein J3B02_003962 [Coemansia erecta]
MTDEIDSEDAFMLGSSDSDSDIDQDNEHKNSVELNEKPDDDLYDQDADDLDAQWVAQNHPGLTDAVLSCPGCFTQICFVCQHHTNFEGQFRALSVVNCQIDELQLYIFGKRGLEPATEEKLVNKGFKKQDIYKLVACAECDTKVGVVDYEDVYHLFHVLPNN